MSPVDGQHGISCPALEWWATCFPAQTSSEEHFALVSATDFERHDAQPWPTGQPGF